MPTSYDFPSRDGTSIRGWRGDGAGPPLVISNGLGAVPEAWPGLIGQDCGYRAVTWYHRGTFGSARPRDPARITVEDHVEDAIALMDHEGIERALVVGWSIGVNVAFSLAERHPDRVAGLLAVAGVPGGTFATMGAPWRVPQRWRRPLAVGVAKTLRTAGPLLTPVSHRIPVTDRTAWLVAHTGLMRPSARPEALAPMLRVFLRQDWEWYMQLAVAAAEHHPMDVSFVRCPTTLVAGRHDVLTSMEAVVETAQRIPHAKVTVLPGSHFLPMEHPALVSQALAELAGRTEPSPAW